MKSKIYIIFILLLAILSEKSIAQATITINCSQTTGIIKHMHGFLHGTNDTVIDAATDTLIRKTKPRFWRTMGHLNGCEKLAIDRNIKTMVVISDLYADLKGGIENAKPWLNWSEYEAFVDTIVQLYDINNLTPDYWDIWNEPEWTWSGSPQQFIECIMRTINVIRSINPYQKITGPGFAEYNCGGMLYLVDTLQTLGVQMDAINWHEFGRPSDAQRHINQMRDSLNVRPYATNMKIQVTEYAAPENAQLSGFTVGFLNAFENSPVDWVNKACWDFIDGTNNWSSCWQGYNGLFWYDETSPLPLYWTFRAYAELQGAKLQTTSTDTAISVIACNDSLNSEMRLLIGRHQSYSWNYPYVTNNVVINITNYPYILNGNIPVVIQRIPNQNIFSPLSAPILYSQNSVSVSGGNLNISIPNFNDGDAYYIYLNPTLPIIADINENHFSNNSISIFPNPFSTQTTLQTGDIFKNATLTVYNSLGQQEKQIKNISGQTITLFRDNLSSGLYLIRLTQDNKIHTDKLIITDN